MKVVNECSLMNYDFENSYCNNIRDCLSESELNNVAGYIDEYYPDGITDDELFDLFYNDFEKIWQDVLGYAVVKAGREYLVRGFFAPVDYAYWNQIKEALTYYSVNIECLEDFFTPDDHEYYSVQDIVHELENASNDNCLTQDQFDVLESLRNIYEKGEQLFTEDDLLYVDF